MALYLVRSALLLLSTVVMTACRTGSLLADWVSCLCCAPPPRPRHRRSLSTGSFYSLAGPGQDQKVQLVSACPAAQDRGTDWSGQPGRPQQEASSAATGPVLCCLLWPLV